MNFETSVPRWPVFALRAAGIYNLGWGIWAVIFPYAAFDLAGMPRPNYPQLWQCIGMIVGVYGVGYFIASRDVTRHWPIVLVGMLGKIFGPIGFLQAFIAGTLPLRFGWLIVFNDIIWWVPFALMLKLAVRVRPGV